MECISFFCKKYSGIWTNSNWDYKKNCFSLISFGFGREMLRHQDHFNNHRGYVGEPKYDNLKMECLNNKIQTMSMKQFARTLYSAFMFRDSMRGRELKASDSSASNKQWEIPVHFPISVSHLLCLLMYCNDTNLKYRYKKFGCREKDNEQTIEELKEWNREIAH